MYSKSMKFWNKVDPSRSGKADFKLGGKVQAEVLTLELRTAGNIS